MAHIHILFTKQLISNCYHICWIKTFINIYLIYFDYCKQLSLCHFIKISKFDIRNQNDFHSKWMIKLKRSISNDHTINKLPIEL